MSNPSKNLAEPCEYFPFASGRYHVQVGLSLLGTDFGNDGADAKIFQIDRQWAHYRGVKLNGRRERLAKYVCEAQSNPGNRRAVTRFLINRLRQEHPNFFALTKNKDGNRLLHCRLSDETLVFNPQYDWVEAMHPAPASISPPYVSALDALACQIQEDIAVTVVPDDNGDVLTALHLCFPNHWAAEQKIGKRFTEIHDPVPHFDRIARQIRPLVARLTQPGTYVRFAWGLATDTHLNHHPEPPDDFGDVMSWRGRSFEPSAPELYLRVERQTLTGIPAIKAFIFTIRTYFTDIATLDGTRLRCLGNAIDTMSEDTLRYKGILQSKHAIQAWLRSPEHGLNPEST